MSKQKLGTILVYLVLPKIIFLSKYNLKKNYSLQNRFKNQSFFNDLHKYVHKIQKLPLIILLNYSKTQQQTFNPTIHLIPDHKELDKPVHNFLARTFHV